MGVVGVLGRRLRLSGGIRGEQELGKGVGSESVLGRRTVFAKYRWEQQQDMVHARNDKPLRGVEI